jgi:hypothetical protein
MDTETIVASVKKTGHAVVVHEAPRTCGIGAEVVARLVEHAFLYLQAPVRRLTGFDILFPYFAREKAYLPNPARITRAVRQTLNFCSEPRADPVRLELSGESTFCFARWRACRNPLQCDRCPMIGAEVAVLFSVLLDS